MLTSFIKPYKKITIVNIPLILSDEKLSSSGWQIHVFQNSNLAGKPKFHHWKHKLAVVFLEMTFISRIHLPNPQV